MILSIKQRKMKSACSLLVSGISLEDFLGGTYPCRDVSRTDDHGAFAFEERTGAVLSWFCAGSDRGTDTG